jgi:energy-coupling factor transporter ATP-binding protein EcfA2
MILLSLQGIQKSFGTNEVLRDASLVLQDGQRMGLVGVNGCGKSTLMKIIAGIETADGGTMTMQKGLKLGYLAQQGQVGEGRTVLEELESGADIVIGSRFLTVKKPKSLRMLGSYIISWSIRLTTGRAICDPTSGMRLFNRAMVEEFAQNLNYGPEPDTISYLIKNGAVVREVQVTMGEREAGQSYLTFWRSIEYMVKMSISILLIQWFRKRDTETPYPERSL